MKKRSVPEVIIFSLITLGIYFLYWTFVTRQELVNKGQSVPRFRWLFAPVATLIVIALAQLFVHAALSSANPDSANGLGSLLNIVSILLGIVAIPSMIIIPLWWFYKYCQAAEAVTKGKLNFGTSYALLLILSFFSLGFIWPGIMQDGFNKA